MRQIPVYIELHVACCFCSFLQYTPGLYDIFRREERCILKIRNVPKYLDNVEISCEVNGDRTACTLTVDGQYRSNQSWMKLNEGSTGAESPA